MRKPFLAVSEDQLLAFLPTAPEGAEAKQCFRIENASEDEAVLEIYDVIWPWEPKRLMAELRETKAKTIQMRINSPGGDAFAGVAIYNALVRHEARVIVDIDGVAASAASLAAMAGDEIRMGVGTKMMIHEARAFTAGTAGGLRETADVLDKVNEGLVEIYVDRTGKPAAEVRQMLAKETWLTADEAIEHGFADAKTKRGAKVSNEASSQVVVSAVAGLLAESISAHLAKVSKPEIETKRQFEDALVDGLGFTREMAKSVAACGFRPEPRDEAGQTNNAASEPRDEAEAVDIADVERLLSTISS